MERMSDVYEIPKKSEFIQCDNPIHNDSINKLTLIEESINRALLNRNDEINNTTGYSKTFKIVSLSILFCILIIVSLIAYYLIEKNQ